jgi:PAS domain S-box-containing protein
MRETFRPFVAGGRQVMNTYEEVVQLRRAILLLAVAWTVCAAGSLAWNLKEHARETAGIALHTARALYEKDVLYREWSSLHGGVYVPATDQTPPNPYLKVAERDVVTPSGKKLTLMNPAYMTRQVFELQDKKMGIRGHITSLKPIRPENAPDAWEREAMTAFENRTNEVVAFKTERGEACIRMMRPLVVTQGCLKCHASQGYELNNIRGGISVTVPMKMFEVADHPWKLAATHGGLWLLGLAGLGGGARRLRRDILKKRQAAEALRQSEERHRALFENSSDALMTLDTEGFLDCNAATVSMFRCADKKEFIGLHPSEISPPQQAVGQDSRTAADQKIAAAFEKGVSQFEWVHRRRTGEEFPAEVLLTAFKLGDRRILEATVRDASERKRAEEERRQLETRQRQQQKMEAIGTLAGGVGHEINNPIFGIMNYAQLIEERLPADSPLRKFAVEIGRESNRVARIVQQLISFSQPKAEAQTAARMADIVNSTLLLVGGAFRNDQIAVTVDVPEDLPKVTCCDQQIQQVLMSLLVNAREALNERYPQGDANKTVGITGRLVQKEQETWLRVTVEDHGIGVPPAIAHQVFDPFFTTKDRSQHAGSGLSVSAAVVRDHGGQLTLESEPDRFTRFHMDLPVR